MRPYSAGILLLVTLGAAGGPVAAQAPDPALTRAAIEQLKFMVGRWQGQAWQQRGAERVQTEMLEVVEPKLDGSVLLVEGRGWISTPGTPDRVVHHALGIVSYDPEVKKFTLRSYLSTGQYGDFALTLVEGGVSWTREVPGGRIRNTAHYSTSEWREIGEFSRDGTTWTQIMEIRLQRQP